MRRSRKKLQIKIVSRDPYNFRVRSKVLQCYRTNLIAVTVLLPAANREIGNWNELSRIDELRATACCLQMNLKKFRVVCSSVSYEENYGIYYLR